MKRFQSPHLGNRRVAECPMGVTTEFAQYRAMSQDTLASASKRSGRHMPGRRNPGRYLHRARTARAGGVALHPNTGNGEAAARASVEAGRVAKVERGGPKDEASQEPGGRWTATRHCPVFVLPGRAKTSFPGTGTLRCAPCSRPPGRQKLAGPVPPGQRASASPSAPEFFQRPKYLEPGPSPRESPGNTKTGRRLGRRPLPGRMGFPTGPAREGGGDYRCVVRGGDTNLLPVAGMPPNTGGVPTAANRVGTAAQGRFWDQSPVGQFVEIGKLNVAGGRSQSAPSVST